MALCRRVSILGLGEGNKLLALLLASIDIEVGERSAAIGELGTGGVKPEVTDGINRLE